MSGSRGSHCIYPRNMVCFRYAVANTQHKGDNKDDDDYDNKNNNIM
jgi:hypothetical protein